MEQEQVKINTRFRYRIYDDDVGNVIHDKLYNTFEELYIDIKVDLLSYDIDDESTYFGGEALFEYDKKHWNVNLVLNRLKTFNFEYRTFEWCCWLPGHHRKFIVSLELSI